MKEFKKGNAIVFFKNKKALGVAVCTNNNGNYISTSGRVSRWRKDTSWAYDNIYTFIPHEFMK